MKLIKYILLVIKPCLPNKMIYSPSFTLETSIKCLKYNKSGSMLILGDKFGCLHIKSPNSASMSSIQTTSDLPEGYDSVSHSINKIEIVESSSNRAVVLASIDKSIKSWKIYPQPSDSGQTFSGKQSFSLDGVHDCTINSLSINPNGQNFISSDDLNLYLWDLNETQQVIHIVNHKQTVSEINEVITSAKFHPVNSSEFLWTSTNGTIRIGDLRTKLIMDKPVNAFKYNSNSNWYYEELVHSISYAEFCRFQQTVVARDYFTVKFWDLRNSSNPYLVADVVADKSLTMREICESQVIFYDFEAKECLASEYVVTGGRGQIAVVCRNSGKIVNVPMECQDFVVHVDVCGDCVAYASDDTIGFFQLSSFIS